MVRKVGLELLRNDLNFNPMLLPKISSVTFIIILYFFATFEKKNTSVTFEKHLL